MTRYTVVLAASINDRVHRHPAKPNAADPAKLRWTVVLAREGGWWVYIVPLAEARKRPLARTLERRLAASPPADTGLPLALAPRRGPAPRGHRPVQLRVAPELVARVDAARGDEDRSAWWARAAERMLEGA